MHAWVCIRAWARVCGLRRAGGLHVFLRERACGLAFACVRACVYMRVRACVCVCVVCVRSAHVRACACAHVCVRVRALAPRRRSSRVRPSCVARSHSSQRHSDARRRHPHARRPLASQRRRQSPARRSRDTTTRASKAVVTSGRWIRSRGAADAHAMKASPQLGHGARSQPPRTWPRVLYINHAFLGRQSKLRMQLHCGAVFTSCCNSSWVSSFHVAKLGRCLPMPQDSNAEGMLSRGCAGFLEGNMAEVESERQIAVT
eukprot:745871-Pleurochrysis_carterae.AAC.1